MLDEQMKNLNPDDFDNICCDEPDCHGNDIFTQKYIAKKVPALQVGAPKDIIMNMPVLVCAECLKPIEEILHKKDVESEIDNLIKFPQH